MFSVTDSAVSPHLFSAHAFPGSERRKKDATAQDSREGLAGGHRDEGLGQSAAGGFVNYRAESHVFDVIAPAFGDLRRRRSRARLLERWLDNP